MLDDLGLEAAAAAECRASFERGGPPVDFQVEGNIDDLTSDASLALYRMIQEGLRNVARHAAAQQVTVRLRGRESEVELEMIDDGSGFDPADPARRPGLGLAGMDERARLLGGRFHLDTAPGRGVHIRAAIPRGART
jgi:two-component system sensor histidine kinase DegS